MPEGKVIELEVCKEHTLHTMEKNQKLRRPCIRSVHRACATGDHSGRWSRGETDDAGKAEVSGRRRGKPMTQGK